MIILDTSFLIDFFKGRNKTLDLVNSDVATTVITFHEIISGAKHKKAKNEEKFFRRFFSEIKVFDFDIRAAEKSSEIMASLLTTGKVVNALDVMIAGIAITNGIDKIASNDKDFIEISKITGLDILKY
ncbi:putative nucleic acid-binding protein, contains PIN domain [Candidatus Methanoperedens nitroreducens]|uniref:Putative nucleic acid-binding protein, contains PIN domain n=1 Tax=Candidatus Methanoperedens nitratireducens TaxID=1392998 RepID=A0A062V2U8_9EURY|nr:type II toxin-antitoxin system VapC family toxin [Candidatus Methanoperedens nitroreducens]KCZ73401.1 putative nucleic acid-binding protein, contains PIN domain [Candidatus Methanoperedens nitroreducens]MDJ1422644.1 type II toxin-antitoxin system VapC family toxin [Candidatus Methanoperedens sp.]